MSLDQITGAATYGAEYAIKCSVTAATSDDRAADANGVERIARHVIYTEDARPKKLDLITFAGADGWEEIIGRTMWEMSAFGDEPDYKLVT